LEELLEMSARVRRLEARDKAQWLALFKGYIAFYKVEIAEDVIETTWRRMLAGDADFHIGLIAVDAGDAPIGLAHILFHRSTWSAGWYCYLEDLFVDPTRRRQGAGRALIEAAYREADARGASRTYWMTERGNHTARSLYDSLATLSPFVQYRR
jgi:GNAT superfamily N-acetyltransferase